jgi:hypothetical protein
MSDILIREGDTCYTITDIVKRFGKHILMKGLENGVYAIGVDPSINRNLIAYGFNKNAIPSAINNIKRGKSMYHLVKSTGKVRKQYIGFNIYDIIESADTNGIIWTFGNRLALLYLHEKMKAFISKRASIFKIPHWFKGIDLNIDPITCDDIVRPVYIRDDWNSGCKMVFDKTTVERFKVMIRTIVGFAVIDGVDVLYYQDTPEQPECYISPYTRKRFTKDAIVEIILS